MAYDALGDVAKSVEYHEKAVAIMVETLGGDHPNTVAAKDMLSNTKTRL